MAKAAKVADQPNLDYIAADLRPLAVPISELGLDPQNARLHPDKNLESIKGSLAAYGQRKPIVVNRRTSHVEAGNGSLQAALALGWRHIAVVWVEDDPTTAAGFAIADNRTAELAQWDHQLLDELLKGIAETGNAALDEMFRDLASYNSAAIVDQLAAAANAAAAAQPPLPEEEFLNFSVPLTTDQERRVRTALRRARGRFAVETTGEALTAALDDWLAGLDAHAEIPTPDASGFVPAG